MLASLSEKPSVVRAHFDRLEVLVKQITSLVNISSLLISTNRHWEDRGQQSCLPNSRASMALRASSSSLRPPKLPPRPSRNSKSVECEPLRYVNKLPHCSTQHIVRSQTSIECMLTIVNSIRQLRMPLSLQMVPATKASPTSSSSPSLPLFPHTSHGRSVVD